MEQFIFASQYKSKILPNSLTRINTLLTSSVYVNIYQDLAHWLSHID